MPQELPADSNTDSREDVSPSQPAADQNLQQGISVLHTLARSVKKQVLGRDDVIDLTVIALVAGGHVLLEDFPGSGKTTLAKALGEAIKSEESKETEAFAAFRRIQFTPDLLPSDVTGVPIFDSNSNAFHFRRGPLFAHIVLADEINRTSPKVQSAMLEAMGEKQITVDNTTYQLDELFFVIATQNPLDMVGTYPLPTPQLDRFLFKITMEHIDRDSEMSVLETYVDRRDHKMTSEFVTRQQVLCARQAIEDNVYIHSAIKACLVDISRNLRGDDRVLQGNSTRSLVLMLPALQVAAALQGRNFVSADDIELLLPKVLGHRVELAPGVTDRGKVFSDCMQAPMEQLARSTLL